MANLVKLRDTLTPDLAAKLRACKNRRPILEAMGQAVKSISVRSFTDPGLRAADWAPRKKEPADGHALLQESTMLRKSVRVIAATENEVVIGSDRPYAAAHQFGRDEINLPARPFLPFTRDGQLTPRAAKNVAAALTSALRKRGL